MERVMYNTVLGAKPLMADGRTFYYSDYNFEGRKVYSPTQHWACCAGTLPQVAADYRINTYFRDRQDVYVNLYIPSTLRWTQEGAEMSLTQKGSYPFDSAVQFDLTASKACNFTLLLRIPAWAQEASVSVNGRRFAETPVSGNFAAIRRQWKNGDRVELELPMTMRLEAVDRQHPETVALMYGPLVLFPITNKEKQPTLTGTRLLAARRVDSRSWQVKAAGAPIKFLPFTDIGEEQYSTYLRIS
jgi:DUF1680 family protein